uniref:Ig-like domain-containing protein n=1 Tax=Salmo trutta TaxID=8032 RepID=A0A674EEY5_SALTR
MFLNILDLLTAAQSSPIHLVSANVGHKVTLHYFHDGNMGIQLLGYKQTFDKTFYHEFKDNPRFSVQSGKGIDHQRISDMQLSDSATCYCVNAYNDMVHFEDGAILIVKGTEITVIQQPVSESVQPGDSVTLNCTIHTETCAGEHSVYWFRHGSGESHPRIIYTNGDRSDQCEKSPKSCVYNLPKRNLSLADPGIYYCAVVSCGEILFENGTKLDIETGGTSYIFVYIYWILYCVKLYTVQVVCINKTYNADSLHYVALNLSNKKNRSRRQRSNMEEESVF